MPLLQVKDLKTHFFTSKGVVKAVDGVSLYVEEDEAVGLVGESGCGKTMTALSVMRLVPDPPGKIVEGEILLKGRNLLELEESGMRKIRGKEVSMVFQDPLTFLNPVMKVVDQISEAIVLHQGLGKREARRKAVKTLELVRIPSPSEVAEYYPHQLSGGMRQRVLIAMALSSNPSLLIADEPTTALDVTIQMQILELLKSLRKELKTSLLLITHDLGIVADICDRVYVMYAGKVVEQGDVFSIYEEPHHPYTQGLLNSALSIDEFKETLKTIEGSVPSLLDPPSGCRFHPRCPYVMKVCQEKEPPLISLGKGRVSACFLSGEKHAT